MSGYINWLLKEGEDASKEEIRWSLQKHEDRETPEQEAQESEKEQDIEDRAGIHEKKGFWVGFEKRANEEESEVWPTKRKLGVGLGLAGVGLAGYGLYKQKKRVGALEEKSKSILKEIDAALARNGKKLRRASKAMGRESSKYEQLANQLLNPPPQPKGGTA